MCNRQPQCNVEFFLQATLISIVLEQQKSVPSQKQFDMAHFPNWSYRESNPNLLTQHPQCGATEVGNDDI